MIQDRTSFLFERNRYLPCFALCSAIPFLFALALRADIVKRATLTAESQFFDQGFGTSNVDVELPDPKGSFDADFGILGDEPFIVIWEAPPGKCFEIAPPLGFDTVQIQIWYEGGSLFASSGSFSNTSPTVQFNGLTGASPNLTPGPEVRLSGPSGMSAPAFSSRVDFFINPGEVMRFKSLEIRDTIPASVNTDFAMVGVDEFGISGTLFGSSLQLPDPGQWIRIIDDPALVAAAAAQRASLLKKIRKLKKRVSNARKSGNANKVRSLRKKLKKLTKNLRSI